MESMTRLQRRLQWAATLVVLLMPLALMWLGPRVMSKGLIPVPWDKLAHVLAFALLAVALGLASRLRGGWALLVAAAGTLLVGALDELLQNGQPNRTADWLDFVADLAGAALGCLTLVVLAELRDRLVGHAARVDEDRDDER